MSGSDNVFIGGDALQTLDIASEVPEWLYKVSDLTLLFAGHAGGWGSVAGNAGALVTATAAAGIIARPVDIVSGQKFLSGEDKLDFVLPSRLPVRWQRY